MTKHIFNFLDDIIKILKKHNISLRDANQIYIIDKIRIDWLSGDDEFKTIPITYDEAIKKLNYNYDPNSGGEESHKILIYFDRWILIKSIYDGTEKLHLLPRHPDTTFNIITYGN